MTFLTSGTVPLRRHVECPATILTRLADTSLRYPIVCGHALIPRAMWQPQTSTIGSGAEYPAPDANQEAENIYCRHAGWITLGSGASPLLSTAFLTCRWYGDRSVDQRLTQCARSASRLVGWGSADMRIADLAMSTARREVTAL